MTSRKLAVLIILGIVALGGGWYFGVATEPGAQQSVDAGKLMFPGLVDKLPQLAKIEIIHQGKPTVIEKHGDVWGLAERDDYPVQEMKLRGMLTTLTELRLVEPRTSDPGEYSRLGVEDPDAKDTSGSADLLRLLDAAGKPIAVLIVGHRRVRTQGDVPEQVYVRRPNETQSWLAEGSLQVDADPQLWLDRDIMNLDHAQIAGVTAVNGDSTLEFGRDDGKFVLKTPADHPKLDDYKLEDVSRALELLSFQDVHKSDDKAGAPVGHSVFTTNDGMAVTVTVFHPPAAASAADVADAAGKEVWVRFAVAGSDKAKPQADKLAARLTGWTYQLGAWKEKSLLPTIDTLKAETEKPPTAAPVAAAPASEALPAAPAKP